MCFGPINAILVNNFVLFIMPTYTVTKFDMAPDYEGKVVCTLIRANTTTTTNTAILYVHGYIDYFFHDNLATAALSSGFGFYAVELRKYGRSYLSGQHFNYCRSIYEYYSDIDRSIEQILQDGYKHVAFIGHSTGGLLTSLYASDGRYKDIICSMVLNSPFLELNAPWYKRHLLIPAVGLISKFMPYASKKNELSDFYGISLHKSYKGRWDYNLAYKPINGVPLYFAWLNAIKKAQQKLHRGLLVGCPTLVLSSDCSSNPKVWQEQLIRQTDIVLNVADIERYSKSIGPLSNYEQITHGIHDLYLSAPDVATKAIIRTMEWITNYHYCPVKK